MTFNPGDSNNYIGGDYYDGNNKEGGWNRDDWTTYTVSHKHFAGKEMAFENKTSEPLTDVKAWFYEPDENGMLKLVSNSTPLNIAPNSTATFNIPDDFALMLSLHGMRAIPQNPAKSITSMVKMLVVMMKNPLHTVI